MYLVFFSYLCGNQFKREEKMELANKVKQLRIESKLSQKDFAQLTGFSFSYIQKFEEGQRKMNTNHLVRFSKVLNVNPFDIIDTKRNSYDLQDSLSFEIRNIEYREKKSHSFNYEKDIIDSISNNFLGLIELENILNEKQKFKNPIEDINISNGEDVEIAVKILRKKWKLGSSPIHDVVYFLENKGIKVFEVQKEYDFIGFSGWAGEIPIIVLNVVNDNLSRRRFTALHELAHLVLSFDFDGNKELVEKLCNHFAGAMLLVDDVVAKYFSNLKDGGVTLRELKMIKLLYGISIQAILLRVKSLNYIDWGTYNRWKQEYYRWLDSDDSLGEFKGNERPVRFFNLIARAVNNKTQKITLLKAAELTKMTTSELKDIIKDENFVLN